MPVAGYNLFIAAVESISLVLNALTLAITLAERFSKNKTD
jgi:hypothetical protein